MFRFWMREIAGWLLVIAGLYVFAVALALLLRPPPPPGSSMPHIIEAPAFIFVGFIIFRGGIHLLKVAVAARVCMQARTEAQQQPVPQKVAKKADGPWDW
jgi:hypothetical protein